MKRVKVQLWLHAVSCLSSLWWVQSLPVQLTLWLQNPDWPVWLLEPASRHSATLLLPLQAFLRSRTQPNLSDGELARQRTFARRNGTHARIQSTCTRQHAVRNSPGFRALLSQSFLVNKQFAKQAQTSAFLKYDSYLSWLNKRQATYEDPQGGSNGFWIYKGVVPLSRLIHVSSAFWNYNTCATQTQLLSKMSCGMSIDFVKLLLRSKVWWETKSPVHVNYSLVSPTTWQVVQETKLSQGIRQHQILKQRKVCHEYFSLGRNPSTAGSLTCGRHCNPGRGPVRIHVTTTGTTSPTLRYPVWAGRPGRDGPGSTENDGTPVFEEEKNWAAPTNTTLKPWVNPSSTMSGHWKRIFALSRSYLWDSFSFKWEILSLFFSREISWLLSF